MPKRLTYKFTIGAFNPESIPMSRLSEYMSDLASLLGEPSSVHFSGIESGSTVLRVDVDTEAIPKVTRRVEQVASDNVPDDIKKHLDALDKRLEEDNATGSLAACTDDDASALVIAFPGCERPKPIDYGVVRERGTIDGVPFSIGGRDNTVHIQLLDGTKAYTGIDLSHGLAIKISDAKCLLRRAVRLHGEGRWQRNPDTGKWDLKHFKVDSFEILEDVPLAETVAELRRVKGSGWADLEDPHQVLRDLREGEESVH